MATREGGDGALTEQFTQKDVSVPDVKGQLQLIHDEVMRPCLGRAKPG